MDDAAARYRAFVRVAELGSFTKAASELGFSQSTISRMVAGLENECGLTLLERSRSGVCLTSEGETLLPAARAIVAAQGEFADLVAGVKGLSAGHIRIGTFSSVATHWMPRLIRRFQADHPGVTYELLLGDYREIEGWVAGGRVDCGFTRLPASPSLSATPLVRDELMAVLPRGHRLACLDAVPAEELAKERFLLLEKDGNAAVDAAFEHCGGAPVPVFTTWDDYAVMAMVEEGMGVSVLPALILRRVPYEIEIRPLARPAYRHIGLVRRRATAQPRVVARFMASLKDAVAEL